MRITSEMLSADAVRQLQANIQRLSRSQEQVSTTRRLNRPSRRSGEHPDRGQGPRTRSRSSTSSSGTSTSPTGRCRRPMPRPRLGRRHRPAGARAPRIQGATGSLSATDRQALGVEVDQLLSALQEQANAKSAGSYLFSGFKTDTAPYATPTGAYLGDAGVIMARTRPEHPGPDEHHRGRRVRARPPGARRTARPSCNAGTQVTGATIGLIDARPGGAALRARPDRLAPEPARRHAGLPRQRDPRREDAPVRSRGCRHGPGDLRHVEPPGKLPGGAQGERPAPARPPSSTSSGALP